MLSMDLFIIIQSIIPFAKKGILIEKLENKFMWSILLGQVVKYTTCLRWRIYVCCLSVVHSNYLRIIFLSSCNAADSLLGSIIWTLGDSSAQAIERCRLSSKQENLRRRDTWSSPINIIACCLEIMLILMVMSNRDPWPCTLSSWFLENRIESNNRQSSACEDAHW